MLIVSSEAPARSVERTTPRYDLVLPFGMISAFGAEPSNCAMPLKMVRQPNTRQRFADASKYISRVWWSPYGSIDHWVTADEPGSVQTVLSPRSRTRRPRAGFTLTFDVVSPLIHTRMEPDTEVDVVPG